MVKKIFWGFAFVAVSACSSDSQESPIVPPAPENPSESRIAKIEMFQDNELVETNEFTYDEKFRPTKLLVTYVKSSQKIEAKLTYTANGIEVIHTENLPGSNLVKPTEMAIKLNEKQRVTELKRKRYFSGGGSDEAFESDFVYDAEQKQLQCVTSFYQSVKTSWTAKNVTKISYEGGSENAEASQVFVYSDKANKIYPDINFFLTGFAIGSGVKFLLTDVLGLRSEHLLQESTFTHNKLIQPTTRKFTYKFDQKQRPIEINQQVSGGNPYQMHYKIHYVSSM